MKKNKALLLFFLLLSQHCLAKNPLYTSIAGIYLPAIQEPHATSQSEHANQPTDPLSDSQCRFIAFKILAQEPDSEQDVCALDTKSWENLELYNNANLLSKLKRTHLKLGEASLGGMIAQPIRSIQELEIRKHTLQTLVEDPALLSSLRTILKKMGTLEPHLLSLWKEESSFFKESLNRFYLAPSLYGSSLINTSPLLLEIFRRSEDLGTFLLAPFSLLYIRHLFKNGTYEQFTHNIAALRPAPALSPGETWLSLFFSGSELFFSLFNVPIALYQTTQYYHATHTALHHLHSKLSYLSQALALAKDIQIELAHHTKEFSRFNKQQVLVDFFDTTKKENSDLKKLLSILESPTFSEKFSYGSHFGRILVAHMLFEQVKETFIPLLIALGKIDAFVSCAQLFKEYQTKSTPFCFAQYSDRQQPYIALTNFWNPLVNSAKVVPNSLQLGHANARNVILTGQNTGGKSTILKGVALTMLLAQTLGIAPAQQALITPFDCLSTYMNITDSAKEGLSLFAAEVDRAKMLMAKLSSLSSEKKGFVVIDEAFKGTGNEAEELSYWYAQQLGRFNNCMCLNATHYPKLTLLERETQGIYHNYKVEVTFDPQGRLVRPFKLERGHTLYNIAEHILIEQGLKQR